MNQLIETLNLWGERAAALAWPMLWQSSLLIAVLFAFDFAFRRRIRASVRYALWLVVLLKLLLPPSLALPTSLAWWVRPSAPVTAAPKQEHSPTFLISYSDAFPTTVPIPAAPVFEPPPKPSLSSGGWAALSWVAICAGLLTWLLVRWWQVARDVRRSTPASERLNELLAEARKAAGVARRVKLRLTTRAMSPAVCGLMRPIILLPQSLIARLTPEQLRAVLLHEVIHLRRGDVWINCLQVLLQIFYWWHPLLWLANARIRRLREEAVDDAVMAALADDADTYAPTLLEVAKLAFNRPLASLGLVGILESRSALRQRIERLVDFRAPRKAGLTIASSLCVLAFAALAVPMEKAPATRATQVSTQEQTESASPPPVELSNDDEEVKLRMIVLYKPVAGEADQIRKLAEGILARVKGGAAFSEMASVYSEHRQGRDGGDWGWVRKRDGNGTPVLRKELADVAFSLEPGEVSGVIETPEVICLMLVEDKRPVDIKAVRAHDRKPLTHAVERVQSDPDRKIEAIKHATPSPPNSRSATNLVFTQRQAIVSKLDRLRLDFVLFEDVPLGEVVLWLKDEAKKRDPESKGINFITDQNAVPPVQQVDPTTRLPLEIALLPITIDPPLINVRLADVLDAIVKAARVPIKYSVEDYAVVFSQKSPDQQPDPLRDGSRTNFMQKVSIAFQSYLGSSGVDLNPLLGKSVFWNDRSGMLLVRATKQDLDTIEQALAKMSVFNYGTAIGQTNRTAFTNLPEGRAEAAALVQEARVLFEAGKLDEAEAKLKRAISIDPGNQAAFYYLSLVKESRYHKAESQRSQFVDPAQTGEQLYVRTFKVPPDVLDKKLRTHGFSSSRDIKTNLMEDVSVAVQSFFRNIGVDLDPLLGKSVFWNFREGTLRVMGTKQDLDIIRRSLSDSPTNLRSATNAASESIDIETAKPAGRPRGHLDKVPVLGDLQLRGRLFRSETNSPSDTVGTDNLARPETLYTRTLK